MGARPLARIMQRARGPRSINSASAGPAPASSRPASRRPGRKLLRCRRRDCRLRPGARPATCRSGGSAAGRPPCRACRSATLATRKATSPRICTWSAAMRSTTPSIDAQSPSVPGATLSSRPLIVHSAPCLVTVSGAGLGALDLGVAAPDDLRRVGEELRLGVRVDRGAGRLGLAGGQRRAEIADRRALARPSAPATAAARDSRTTAAATSVRPAASGRTPRRRAPGRRARGRYVALALRSLSGDRPLARPLLRGLGSVAGRLAAGEASGPAARRAARPRPAWRRPSPAARAQDLGEVGVGRRAVAARQQGEAALEQRLGMVRRAAAARDRHRPAPWPDRRRCARPPRAAPGSRPCRARSRSARSKSEMARGQARMAA